MSYAHIKLPKDDFSIVLILKCASQSIGESLRKHNAEFRPGTRKVGFIRDPLARVVSAFYFLNQQKYWKQAPYARSYTDWVDYILTVGTNPHVLPQTKCDVNEWYAFEDLPEVWKTLYPGVELLHLNASTREVEIDQDYRRQELINHYHADYSIRNQIQS